MNCLMTPYLTEIVEPKKFGNSVGILNLFRGFGCFLGPYLSGSFELVQLNLFENLACNALKFLNEFRYHSG